MPQSSTEPKPREAACHSVMSVGVTYRKLPAEVTCAFRQQCKNHGIRLQAGFLSSLLFSVAQRIWSRTSSQNSLKIICQSPVNLRPFLSSPVRLEQLGCFITTVYIEKVLSQEDSFWQTAGDIHHDLHRQLTADLPRKTYDVTRTLLSECSTFDQIKTARKPDCPFVGVSNLGQVDFSSLPDNLRVTFAYPMGALQGTFYHEDNMYMVLLTLNSETFISFIYPQNLLSAASANLIADDVVERIEMNVAAGMAV